MVTASRCCPCSWANSGAGQNASLHAMSSRCADIPCEAFSPAPSNKSGVTQPNGSVAYLCGVNRFACSLLQSATTTALSAPTPTTAPLSGWVLICAASPPCLLSACSLLVLCLFVGIGSRARLSGINALCRCCPRPIIVFSRMARVPCTRRRFNGYPLLPSGGSALIARGCFSYLCSDPRTLK